MKMKLFAAALALVVLQGCASGSVRLGKDPAPKTAQQEYVNVLFCSGQNDQLTAYFDSRGTDPGTRIEMKVIAQKQCAAK